MSIEHGHHLATGIAHAVTVVKVGNNGDITLGGDAAYKVVELATYTGGVHIENNRRIGCYRIAGGPGDKAFHVTIGGGDSDDIFG